MGTSFQQHQPDPDEARRVLACTALCASRTAYVICCALKGRRLQSDTCSECPVSGGDMEKSSATCSRGQGFPS